jgi:hypothetical protein
MEAHGAPVSAASQPLASVSKVSGAYRCANCGLLSIAYLELRSQLRMDSFDELADQLESNPYTSWLPLIGVSSDYPDVPAHIAEAASEAHKCHSIGAYRAAMSLARSVVEATAKEKGVTKGRLIDKIEKLEEERIIRPTVAAGCHEVRHLGNDIAHGDFTDPVTSDEAGEVLMLMAELLHDVFQQDARVERMRAAREAKKAASA